MEEDKNTNQNNEPQDSMFSDINSVDNNDSSMFSDSLFDGSESNSLFAEAPDATGENSAEIGNSSDVQEVESSIDNNTIPEENINDIKEDYSVENTSEAMLNSNVENKSVDFDEFENTSDEANISDSPESLITVRPVKFQHFQEANLNLTIKKNLDILQDVPMHITVELGRTKSTIKDIINMNIGSVVELNKIAGEQVEIFVNDKLVARGEVIVIEDKFGVRVVNTNIPKEMA